MDIVEPSVQNDTDPKQVPKAGESPDSVPVNLPGQELVSPEPDEAVEPKKYIRTFAMDIEVLQQGGIPDLAPYTRNVGAPMVAAMSAAAPPAPQKVGPPPPSPAFRPEPLPQMPQAQTEHLNILTHPPERPSIVSFPMPAPRSAPLPPVFSSPPPLSAPVAPPPQPLPPPTPILPPPKPAQIQTYSSDFSDRLKDTRASSVTVLAAEQDAKRGPVRASPPEKKGGVVAVVAGVLLLLIGGVGAYYAYTKYLANMAPVFTEPVVTAPIFVNETQEVSGSGAVLVRAIEQSLSRPPAPNAVRALTLSATTTNVFFALALPAPDVLLRNLSVSPSVAGIVHVGSSASVFFILPAASYSDTFAGMLLWEPNMLRDFGTLYPPLASDAVALPPQASASTTASTTPKSPVATTSAPAPRFVAGFADEVIQNHDVRVYRDERGKARILYGYWNQRTLIIARDPEAFEEILSRLANSRIQR